MKHKHNKEGVITECFEKLQDVQVKKKLSNTISCKRVLKSSG